MVSFTAECFRQTHFACNQQILSFEIIFTLYDDIEYINGMLGKITIYNRIVPIIKIVNCKKEKIYIYINCS